MLLIGFQLLAYKKFFGESAGHNANLEIFKLKLGVS